MLKLLSLIGSRVGLNPDEQTIISEQAGMNQFSLLIIMHQSMVKQVMEF